MHKTSFVFISVFSTLIGCKTSPKDDGAFVKDQIESNLSVCGIFRESANKYFLEVNAESTIRLGSSGDRDSSLKTAKYYKAFLDAPVCFVKPRYSGSSIDLAGYWAASMNDSLDAVLITEGGKAPLQVKPEPSQISSSQPYTFSEAPADNPLIRYMRNYPMHYGVLTGPAYRYKETRGSTFYADRFERSSKMQLEEWVRQRMMSGKGPFPSQDPMPAMRTWEEFYGEHVKADLIEQGKINETAEDDGPYLSPKYYGNNVTDGADIALFYVKAPTGAVVHLVDEEAKFFELKILAPVKSDQAEPIQLTADKQVRKYSFRISYTHPTTGKVLKMSSPYVEVPAGQKVQMEFKLSSNGEKMRLLWW